MYGSADPKQVQNLWEETFQKIRRAEGFILGVPSDTGAGIMKGANFGPLGVREAYFDQFQAYPKNIIDLGDVICVPHFLHDEMLSPYQLTATRKELYPGQEEPLPVSPLSIAEGVLKAVFELNPQARVYLIGGDHSVSWPSMVYCHSRFGKDFGVLHFDAHTDLMTSRLGVDYCFATWAYQALKFLKPHHLVQVGIRSSAKTKAQWAELHPVTQFWAPEVLGHEAQIIQKVCQHFSEKGIKSIYISNDIDGTDSSEASATGTPEPAGLKSEFVKELISEVKSRFSVFGGDVVEVAPPLSGKKEFKEEATCRLGAQYLHELIQ
ncbi:MAG: arginase family protein [Proteobacteria bacterium]|nr:arginase family protein [Pseudomonadota bacterium]